MNSLKLPNETDLKNWIKRVIEEEKKSLGEIDIIFVDEIKEIEINQKFLKHNYPTDIITFDKSFLNKISGELFIAIDVIKENAIFYASNNLKKELHRVIIHGILHMLGYNDKSESEIKIMRQAEEKYLSYLE